MKKRDYGSKWFTIIIIVLIIGAIAYFFLNTKGEEDISSEQAGEANSSENQTVTQEITACSDYKNQEDCLSNYYNVSANCAWNSTSNSCDLAVVDEEIDEMILDVEATSLNLENLGCKKVNITDANITVKECDVSIRGVFKNIGTATIDTDFSVHLLDITDRVVLIKVGSVVDPLAPQEEREITAVYNTTAGERWIKLRVDPSLKLEEVNETNNEITEFIKVL